MDMSDHDCDHMQEETPHVLISSILVLYYNRNQEHINNRPHICICCLMDNLTSNQSL